VYLRVWQLYPLTTSWDGWAICLMDSQRRKCTL